MGLVSEYEEREAAVYVLCPWRDWDDLPWQERARAVAHYRLHMLIEMHLYDAQERHARTQQQQQPVSR